MKSGKYADVEKVLRRLGLEEKNPAAKNPAGAAVGEVRIRRALEDAQVDAVEVTRCEGCFYCVRTRRAWGWCACPEKRGHPVMPEGYCNFGRPKEARHG